MTKLKKRLCLITLSITTLLSSIGGLVGCLEVAPVDKTTKPADTENTIKQFSADDGKTPLDFSGSNENIYRMAYVLQNQSKYHSYSLCDTKSSGANQATRSWKDYQDGVMITSDITSGAINDGNQIYFKLNDGVAYMRKAYSKSVSKNSTSTEKIEWRNTLAKTYANEDEFIPDYGKFPTGLTVYLLNDSTIIHAYDVETTAEGLYSQKFDLKPGTDGATYYYRHSMKTHGALTKMPDYRSLSLTFTFDENWVVQQTFAEEETYVRPMALGGRDTRSLSTTTNTFSYGSNQFDAKHFGYIADFENLIDPSGSAGGSTGGNTSSGEPEQPSAITVLGNAFAGVLSTEGEQFCINLAVGENVYTVYLLLGLNLDGSIWDSTLKAIVAKGENAQPTQQDLYLEYVAKTQTINAYLGTDPTQNYYIAMQMNGLSKVVDSISNAFNGLLTTLDEGQADEGQADEEDLLTKLLSTFDDNMRFGLNRAQLYLNSDNFLDTGLGLTADLRFSCNAEGMYNLTSGVLSGLSYEGTPISATLSLKKANVNFQHDALQTPFKLDGFVDEVLYILNSKTYQLDLNFDGSQIDGSFIQSLGNSALTQSLLPYVDLLKDFKLQATIVADDNSQDALNAELVLGVIFKNKTLVQLHAHASLGDVDQAQGNIYLDITKLLGVDTQIPLHTTIADIQDVIAQITEVVNAISSQQALSENSEEEVDQTANLIANIITSVTNLDFSTLLSKVQINDSTFKVSVNMDAILPIILDLVDVDLSLTVGDLDLQLYRAVYEGETIVQNASFALALQNIGLSLQVTGGEAISFVPLDQYHEVKTVITELLKLVDDVQALLASDALQLDIQIVGSQLTLGETTNEQVLNIYDQIKPMLDKMEANVTIKVNMAGLLEGNITGEANGLTLTYNDKEVAQLSLAFVLDTNDITATNLYITISQLLGVEVDIAYQTTVAELQASISSIVDKVAGMLPQAMAEEEEATELGIIAIVESVVSYDYTALLNSLILGATEEQASITLNLNEVLNLVFALIGQDNILSTVDFGNATLVMTHATQTLTTNVMGIDLSLKGSTAVEIVKDNYGALLPVLNTIESIVSDVASIVTSDAYYLTIELDGSQVAQFVTETADTDTALAKTIKQVASILADFTLSAQVTVNAKDLSFDTQAYITIGYKGEPVAKLNVLLLNQNDLYLTIDEVLGIALTETSMQGLTVGCQISEIGSVIEQITALINSFDPDPEEGEVGEVGETEVVELVITDIIEQILSLDFATLFNGTEIDAQQNTATLRIKLQPILNLVYALTQVEDLGLNFADESLALTLIQSENPSFALGLTQQSGLIAITLGATQAQQFQAPSCEFNLQTLVQKVTYAVKAVQKIVDQQALTAGVEVSIAVDNITFTLKGNIDIAYFTGEKTDVKLFADLLCFITEEGNQSGQEDALPVQLWLDTTQNVAGATQPVVKVALGRAGLDIYQADMQQIADLIDKIMAKIDEMSTPDQPLTEDQLSALVEEEDQGIASLFGSQSQTVKTILTFLASDNFQQLINHISLVEGEDTLLQLMYQDIISLQLSAEQVENTNALSVCLNLANILNINLSAQSTTADQVDWQEAEVSRFGGDVVFLTTAQTEKSFLNVLHSYLYNVLDEIFITDLFNGENFTVQFNLIGDNSGIEQLQGVIVNAEILFGEQTTAQGVVKGVRQISMYIEVNGITINATASYYNQAFYFTLKEVNGMNINLAKGEDNVGLNLCFSAEDIYASLEQIVDIITNTNLLSTIGDVLHLKDAQSPDNNEQVADLNEVPESSQETKDALTQVLTTIFNLNLDQWLTIERVQDIQSGKTGYNVFVDADAFADNFGLDRIAGYNLVGATLMRVDQGDQSSYVIEIMSGNKVEGEYTYQLPWVNLTAKTAQTSAEQIHVDKYAQLTALPILLKDLQNTATNANGEVYTTFSFSGTVSAKLNIPVIGGVTVTIDVATLTIGAGDGGIDDFYVSLLGKLHGASKLFYTVTKERNISLTYSHGYITMGINVGTPNAEYKMMTLDYLMDHILTNRDPILPWYLGMDDGLWNIVVMAAGSQALSSTNTPDNIYLGQEVAQKQITSVTVSDYLTGLSYPDANGSQVAIFNGVIPAFPQAGVQALKLNANTAPYGYYGVSADLSKLSDMMGPLYVALIRGYADETATNFNGDLRGEGTYLEKILANTSIVPVSGISIDINVSLSKYMEGIKPTKWVDGETTSIENIAAPNFYNSVSDYVDEEELSQVEYKMENDVIISKTVFGCFTYNIASGEGKIDKMEILSTVEVQVTYPNGEVGTMSVKYGSKLFGTVDGTFYEGYTDAEGNSQLVKYYVNDELISQDGYVVKEPTQVVAKLQDTAYTVTLVSANTQTEITLESHYLSAGSSYTLPTAYDVVDSVTYKEMSLLYWQDKDGNVITSVTDIQANVTIYGVFVQKEYIDNEVIYQYNTEDGTYHITGYTQNFQGSDGWLVLLGKVNGFTVSTIDEKAFEKIPVANILVVEEITKIGGRAFLDATTIKNIVFLADTVEFLQTGDRRNVLGGSAEYTGYPFYGCSSSLVIYTNKYVATVQHNTGDKKNELIYFADTWSVKRITAVGAGKWAIVDIESVAGFEQYNATYKLITNMNDITAIRDAIHHAYVDPIGFEDAFTVSYTEFTLDCKYHKVVFSVIDNKNYAQVTYNVTGADAILADYGVAVADPTASYINQKITKEDIANAYLTAINTITANSTAKFRNGYTVQVTITGNDQDAISIDGSSYVVDVTITFVPDQVEYLLVVNHSVAGSITISYQGGSVTSGNSAYIKCGTAMTFAGKGTSDSNILDSWSLNGEDQLGTTFVMTQAYVVDAVFFSQEAIVKSELTAVMNNVNINADGVSIPAGTVLSDISYTGYVFLGWTYEEGTALKFYTGEAQANCIYHAVWMTSTNGITATGITVDNGSLQVANYQYEGHNVEVEGLYTDNTFATKLVDTPNTITVTADHTILYARVSYNVEVYMSGNSTAFYTANQDFALSVTSSGGLFSKKYTWKATNGAVAVNSPYSKVYGVLEGEYITLNTSDNNQLLKVTYGSTLYIRGVKTNGEDRRVYKVNEAVCKNGTLNSMGNNTWQFAPNKFDAQIKLSV